MGVVSGAFTLLRQRWLSMLAIAGLGTALLIVGVILGLIGVAISLEPGLLDIIRTTSRADYNPTFDPVDRAFEDSITWEWNGGIVLIVLGVIAAALGQYGGFAAGILHLASARAGQPRSAPSCVAMMLRRALRWFGVWLLWSLGYLLAVGVPVVLMVVAANTLPVLLVILVPLAIAAVIYVFPMLQLAPIALVLAPRGTPPFRHAVALVRADWGGIAIRTLLLNLIGFGMSIGLNIVGIIPLLGLLVSIPASIALYSYYLAGGVLLYEYAEGQVDPQIPETALS
jgi:hypothetical protein